MKKFITIFFCIQIVFMCMSCISLSESSVNSALVTAKLRMEFDEYDEAIVALSRAIGTDPKNEEALKLRGECYCRKNQLELALEDFNALTDLYKSSEYLLIKADVEYELDLYDKVIEDCLEAERISNNNLEKINIWYLLANSYFKNKKFEDADKYYTCILDIAKSPDVYFERATNFVFMKKYGDAKKDLTEMTVLLQKYPNKIHEYLNDEYYYLLGYCELALRNYDDALDAFNKIINKQEFDNIDSYVSACLDARKNLK